MFPLYDTLRSRRFPFVNWILIISNVLIFIHEVQLNSSDLRNFIEIWGIIPIQLISQPNDEWQTLFSSMFLHGGWFHILSNMWILYIFGDNVEDSMGKVKYLIFYLLCGISAGLLQTYILPTSSVAVIGASGAIAGVLGAYLILYPRSRIVSLVPILFIFTLIEIPAIIFLLLWFVTQIFSGVMSLNGASGGGVAWWAHIGGFLFGILTLGFFVRRRSSY